MKNMLKSAALNGLIVVCTLLVCALVGEGLIRVYLRTHTVYDIEMSRYATLLKTDSPNPLIGHVHKPNSSATLMNVPVRINSDGLRDVEHAVARDGRYRVVFLGDSLTFGWGVNEAESFKTRLEAALNQRYPAEILNFGIGNYNSEQEVNLFIEKGLKYQPDKVVVFYFINDAEPTPRKSSLAFLDHSRLITFYWSRIHALLSNLSEKGDNYKTYYANLYGAQEPGWINAQKALLQLRDLCIQKGIELQVVLLPELHELRDYPFAREHRVVTEFLEKNGVAVLDLAPLFKDEAEPMRLWVAFDDAHPNALAHRLIAEYTLEFIATRRFDEKHH